MNKSKNGVFGVLLVTGLLAIASVGTVVALNTVGSNSETLNQDSSTNKNIQSNITATNSVMIRKLNSGVDGGGHDYQTFSYTTTPEYIQENTPIITITFADNRNNGSNYLTSSVNTASKTITLTCLNAFNSRATVRVAFSEDIYATITVDYKEKFANIAWNTNNSLNIINYNYDSSKYVTGSDYDHHPDFLDLISSVNDYDPYRTVAEAAGTIPVSANIKMYGTAFYDEYTPVNDRPSFDDAQNGNLNNYLMNTAQWTSNYGYQEYNSIKSAFLDTAFSSVYQGIRGLPANHPNASLSNSNVWSFDNDWIGGFSGLYGPLDNAWSSLSASNKQIVANNLVNGRIPIVFKPAGRQYLVYHPDYENPLYYSGGGYPVHVGVFNSPVCTLSPIVVLLEPMPSWGLGTRATSMSVETSSITF